MLETYGQEAANGAGRQVSLDIPQDAELRESRDTIVQPVLFNDFPVYDLEDRDSGKSHFPTGVCRQRSLNEVTERWAGMGTSTVPLPDDVIALGDKIRGSPEIKIRECLAEVGHEGLDVRVAPARLVKRILQEHVGRGDLIDNG